MQTPHHTALGGGLDLVTPAITIDPGRCIAASNYEPADRGYRRIDGYERFDGRSKPSLAEYWVLSFDAGDTEVLAGQTVTGGTSGATGIALFDGILGSGSYAGSDAAGRLVLAEVSGTFEDNEDLEVSASPVASANGTALLNGGLTDAENSSYTQAAIERRRALIGNVLGSGDVRGVWTYNGSVWAIRDHNTSPTTTNNSVAASADDAVETVGTGAVSITATGMGLQEDRIVGLRFQALALAATDQIFSAKVQFASTLDLSGPIEVTIYGEYIGDAPAFTTSTNDISARTKTTASVTWRPLPWLASAAGAEQLTPDLAPIINEILGHADWASGNDIALIFETVTLGADGLSRQVASQDHASLAAPQLQLIHAASADEARLWKATTSGWSQQSLGRELAFTSGGTTEIVEGDTITGATSAATAVVTRVTLESGSWAGGDAAGRFIFASQTGTFQAENIDVGASPNLATIGGDSSAITLEPGGRYEFTNHNFGQGERMYGAGGVDRAFEWDGTVFVPIHTGLAAASDKPTRVQVHRNHLFLSYATGAIQNSATGDPYNWESANGAAEINFGHEVTNMLAAVQGVLVITGANLISILYGNDSSDFELKEFADDAGAQAWTMQDMDAPYFLDRRGVRSLQAADVFGDFQRGTATRMVEPLIRQKLRPDAGITAAASIRCRAKDQYRLFWSDGTGITISFLHEQPEILPFALEHIPTATCSGEDDDDREILIFGDANGWVFELDAGTSFDGQAVRAFIRPPFNHLGSPSREKRFHKITLEVDAAPGTEIAVIPEFSYAHPDNPSSSEISADVEGGGGFWDEALWDQFYWSAPVEGLAEVHIDGIGINISAAIVTEATYVAPHTIHGMWTNYSLRRQTR